MMKNRTKKMMFMTLVATMAVAALLMTKGLAAPAAPKTCPDSTALANMLKSASDNPNCPTGKAVYQLINGSPSSADLQSLLNGSAKTDVSSLLNNAKVKEMLDKAKVKAPTATACPQKPTVAPRATAKPTATSKPTATVKPASTPAPTATVKPTATPKPSTPPTSGSMSAQEQKMINLVNGERTAAGLSALTFDAGLRAGAIQHSADMSKNNFFSHTSPTNGGFSQRIAGSGVKYASAGENLAMYGTVEKAHEGLMNSSGHRANIMNSSYTRIGIGIVYNAERGYYYITQWFAK